MKASELIEILAKNPDAEVVVFNDLGEVVDSSLATICNVGEELEASPSYSLFLTSSTPYDWPVALKQIIFVS